MTELFVAGGENSSHLESIAAAGISHVAVNIGNLLRGPTSWELDLGDGEWVAYSDDIVVPADDLKMVVGLAWKAPKWVVGSPEWEDFPGYVPIWNGEGDLPEDAENGICITTKVMRDKAMLRRVMAVRSQGAATGVITGNKSASLRKFDFVVSSAWISVPKFGETQVWDGKDIRRYNATRKGEVRNKHSHHIEALGVDLEGVLEDKPEATTRLALASWKAYAESISGAPVPQDPPETELEANTPEIEGGDRGAVAVASNPSGREVALPLPTLAYSDVKNTVVKADGTEQTVSYPVTQSTGDNLRQCNNCHLAKQCPEYKPGAKCAFNFPVQLRNADQWRGAFSTILEVQMQRVMDSRFMEMLQGQELDETVGSEMDRFFRMAEKMSTILDERDHVKVTTEVKGPGALASIFGTHVADNARAATGAPQIESGQVVDAEIVE